MSFLNSVKMYLRFTWGLRKFLKETVTAEQAREVIKSRLKNREQNLLTIVKKAVYENNNSPYLKLLKLAGCEYEDFERMVKTDGIKPALKKLYQKGVYISIEEFKGKKEVIRGSNVFQFKAVDFDNPYLSGQFQSRSGGSRSAGTRTIYDFDYFTEHYAYNVANMYDAHEATDFPIAMWLPIIGAGPVAMMTWPKGGMVPEKWFSPVEKKGFKPSLRRRFIANYMVYMSRISGVKMPAPEYIPMSDALKVAKWVADKIKEHGGCNVLTYTSAAVAVCQAAKENGLDIKGAKFSLGGEPITEVKHKEVESVGAISLPIYAMIEAGTVGLPCSNPIAVDDVHLTRDSFAIIQQPREVPHAAVSVDALLFTSLLTSAPKVLLNVESGDYATVESRSCGCKLGELGLTEHLYNIRGFDKLTSAGMTFVGTDMVRIIEEVLPSKFGGSSTDYQMVEEEDERGKTHMSVIVNPKVGDIDEAELKKTILDELAKGADTQRMMAQVWSQSKTLRVKRIRPYTTDAGKLLPLHIKKAKNPKDTTS